MVVRRAVALAAAQLLLTVPSSAWAQVFACGQYETLSDCNQRMALAQKRMADELRQTAGVRANVMQSIQDARTRFWATYPDKPAADQARADFAYWLFVKDIYYLRENLKAPVTKDPRTGRRSSAAGASGLDTFGGAEKIDDGIRPEAQEEFDDWVNAVRDKLFAGHASNSTDDAFIQGFLSTWMGQQFVDAVNASTKEYQVYVAARDWWEFDRANRAPAGFDTPTTYGVYLYSRFQHLPVPAAAANCKKMTELIGAERVQAAAKRVMAAPKRGDGGLVVTVEAVKKGPGGGDVIDYDKAVPADIIGAFADPVRVMEMLATQDDDRGYLFDLLHRQAPDLRRIDPATTWTWAETAYKRLVLAFGEPQLLAASHAVRLAPKRLSSGGVMNVKDLGVTRTEPIEAVEDLLAIRDPRGYVRTALIFAKDLDTAAGVDAAYKTYVSSKGEPAVLDAARRRAVNKPQLTFKPELGFIDAEITTPTVAPAKSAEVDRPEYLAWKRFTPGASATYVNRGLGPRAAQDSELVAGAVGIRARYLLVALTPDRAGLSVTEIAYDPPPQSSAHPPHETDVAYLARIAADALPDPSFARTPLQSGDETLVIAGKSIVTHWAAEQLPSPTGPSCSPTIHTTWTSPEVPGGLVRETLDKTCHDNRSSSPSATYRTISEKLIESFEVSGPTSGVHPVQASAAIAPVLPLHVLSSLPRVPPPAAPTISQPAVPAAPVAIAGPPNPRRAGADPNARTGAASTSSAAAPSSGSGGMTVPEGAVLTVTTQGKIDSSNHAGDVAHGTVVQAVLVNGKPMIPANTPVTLELAQANDGVCIEITSMVINGRTVPATSAAGAPDARTEASNASIRKMIDTGGGRDPRRDALLTARLVVVSGATLNVPSGTRLTFALAAPLVLAGR